MLKTEFEEFAKKEVTAEIFAIYEAMYNALPERYTKKDFFNMLDVNAIPEAPEAPEAIERKKKRAEFIQGIKTQIADIKKTIAEYNDRIILYKQFPADEWCVREIRFLKDRINYCKNEIKQLQYIIN